MTVAATETRHKISRQFVDNMHEKKKKKKKNQQHHLHSAKCITFSLSGLWGSRIGSPCIDAVCAHVI